MYAEINSTMNDITHRKLLKRNFTLMSTLLRNYWIQTIPGFFYLFSKYLSLLSHLDLCECIWKKFLSWGSRLPGEPSGVHKGRVVPIFHLTLRVNLVLTKQSLLAIALNTELGAKGYFPIHTRNNNTTCI